MQTVSESTSLASDPPDGDPDPRPDDERQPTGVLGWRRSALILAVVVVGVVATLSAVGVSGFGCTTCHRAMADVRRDSKHAALRCWDCHEEPGSLGKLARPLEVLRMGAAQLTGRKPSTPAVDAGNCLACHRRQMLEIVVGKRIRVRHADFAESVACESCHGEHRQVPTRPVLDKCTVCHNGEDADNTCDTCHVGEPPGIERSSGWMATIHDTRREPAHGFASFETCSMCHDSAYCARCHERARLPHGSGPDWQLTHGTAAARSSAGCMSCHQKRECDACHSLAMPHPVGWLPRHSAEAERYGLTLCYSCHDEKNCLSCHTRHVHPYGFSSRRGR